MADLKLAAASLLSETDASPDLDHRQASSESFRRRLFRAIAVPVLRCVAGFFFSRKYLRGRFFDSQFGGWIWVWRSLWTQKLVGINRHIPWPVSPSIAISNARNLIFHVDDINNFQTMGCYFQNFGAVIRIGRGTFIAPNVGIITSNHDKTNLDNHLPGQDVTIGERCWIGMNAVILPGVVLGPETIVGAGAVVTKSFPEGRCSLAGVPARVICRQTEISSRAVVAVQ